MLRLAISLSRSFRSVTLIVNPLPVEVAGKTAIAFLVAEGGHYRTIGDERRGFELLLLFRTARSTIRHADSQQKRHQAANTTYQRQVVEWHRFLRAKVFRDTLFL